MGISTDIRDRIVAIEILMEYDSANVKAAKYVPESFQPFQLPLFTNPPVGSARSQRADTFYENARTWRLDLWSRKEGDGLRSENEDRVLDLIDLVYDLFVSRPRLELDGAGLTNVVSFEITNDSGPTVRSFPTGGKNYFYMVEFTAIIVYRSICT